MNIDIILGVKALRLDELAYVSGPIEVEVLTLSDDHRADVGMLCARCTRRLSEGWSRAWASERKFGRRN